MRKPARRIKTADESRLKAAAAFYRDADRTDGGRNGAKARRALKRERDKRHSRR